MITMTERINAKLTNGYKVVGAAESKASQYFYINNGTHANHIKARISNHDAMCVASKSNIQVVSDYVGGMDGYWIITLPLDIETKWDDNDMAIDTTAADVISEINNRYGVMVEESWINEFCDDNAELFVPVAKWELMEELQAGIIAYKVAQGINTSNLY